MRLWACWTLPPGPLGTDDVVLSFLTPADEARLPPPTRVLSARRPPREARDQARAAYLETCSRLAAAPDVKGATLRSRMVGGTGSSRWWHHPTSFRDCESDPAFGRILACFAIRHAAAERGLSGVVLCGAEEETAEALRADRGFTVRSVAPRRRSPRAWWWLRGLAARWRTGVELLRQRAAAARVPRRDTRFDVLLASFWDWSVWPRAAGLEDRYYKTLPAALSARGLRVGWLAWFDPDGEPSKEGRSWDSVVAPLSGRNDVVLLQSYLGVGDILRALADLRPLRAYLAWRRRPDRPALFAVKGLNLWPIFEERLLRGFVDGCLPRCALVELAAERAARAHAPRLLVSFLEHNPFARALMTGTRRGSGALCAAMQHASLSAEKTFYFLDPETDFRGRPDRRPAPCPDVVLAMGEQSRSHFLSCGYSAERVLITGGPRFDHLRLPDSAPAPRATNTLRVLAVSTLDTGADIDMVEALTLAARGLSGIELRVRDHPFSRISAQPRFAPLADRIRVSDQPLAEDLAWADLLVYTYSTVAEEAFIAGKPVWQWLPLSFNGSALTEVANVPQFASTAELREALVSFQKDPSPWLPNDQARHDVCERLFFRADGASGERAAEVLDGLLKT